MLYAESWVSVALNLTSRVFSHFQHWWISRMTLSNLGRLSFVKTGSGLLDRPSRKRNTFLLCTERAGHDENRHLYRAGSVCQKHLSIGKNWCVPFAKWLIWPANSDRWLEPQVSSIFINLFSFRSVSTSSDHRTGSSQRPMIINGPHLGKLCLFLLLQL